MVTDPSYPHYTFPSETKQTTIESGLFIFGVMTMVVVVILVIIGTTVGQSGLGDKSMKHK